MVEQKIWLEATLLLYIIYLYISAMKLISRPKGYTVFQDKKLDNLTPSLLYSSEIVNLPKSEWATRKKKWMSYKEEKR